LYNQALEKSLAVLDTGSSDAETRLPQSRLKAVADCVEKLESAIWLTNSLRRKFLGPCGEKLLEELVVNGETTITSYDQRNVIECFFARSRALAKERIHEAQDGRSIFDEFPLSKEFILVLGPTPDGLRDGAGPEYPLARLYAQVLEEETRVAIVRSFHVL